MFPDIYILKLLKLFRTESDYSFHEHGFEPSSFLEAGDFLKNCQLLKEDPASWSCFQMSYQISYFITIHQTNGTIII
jgi:hypothetical protein